ncbi:MAG: trypsin-like serine protease [Verrucomicrobiales bacterium]|nr:trypsin-like serine protease [Verrucomicrobiota bacterium JB025]
MNPSLVPVATLALIALPAAGRASTIIDSADDPAITAQAYENEALLYPMVGTVKGSGLSGSGVLISPEWVLTAGHVSLSKSGGTFTAGGSSYQIDNAVTHPGFSFSGLANDLGLLHLATPVAGTGIASMVRLSPADSILGQQATWVGHGLTGTGLTGATTPLAFRAFTNVIDVMGPEYGQSATSFVADFDRPDGSTNASSSDPAATRLEGNLTSGDSGGGVFIHLDGTPYLVGINSYSGGFSPGTNSKYGSISGATDLSQFHSWIFDETGISAVPEPSVILLTQLATLILLRRSRRF